MLFLDTFKKVEKNSEKKKIQLPAKNATGAVVTLIAIQNLGLIARIELREDALPIYHMEVTQEELEKLQKELTNLEKKVIKKDMESAKDYVEEDVEENKTE